MSNSSRTATTRGRCLFTRSPGRTRVLSTQPTTGSSGRRRISVRKWTSDFQRRASVTMLQSSSASLLRVVLHDVFLRKNTTNPQQQEAQMTRYKGRADKGKSRFVEMDLHRHQWHVTIRGEDVELFSTRAPLMICLVGIPSVGDLPPAPTSSRWCIHCTPKYSSRGRK